MPKIFLSLWLTLACSYAALATEIDKLEDMNTAESFWDIFNAGKGINTYSGWGTGIPAATQARPFYGTAAFSYNNPATFGYGGYGTNAGGYGNNGIYGVPVNYYAKVQVPVYTPYANIPAQPTYENYGTHGGHGFGKYGNY